MAMREQAPEMFKELTRSGTLDQFVEEKCREAAELRDSMMPENPTMAEKREVAEIVRAQLIEFPNETETDTEEMSEEELAFMIEEFRKRT